MRTASATLQISTPFPKVQTMTTMPRPAFALTILSLCAIAGASAQADPDRTVAGGGTMPPGWHAHRPQRAAQWCEVRDHEPGQHVTLGPAAIFWRDADSASGNFTVEAKLWLFSVPRHPEGYGLFIGGSDLSGAGQRYTYFIIRHDGSFLIKRRTGDSTSFVTPKWTPSSIVAKPDSGASGDLPKSIENTLTIRVAGETVSFLINGTQVFSAPATDVDARGVVGYRVNHNLNVHLGPLQITRQ
jgi:hypothetical protein